MMYGLPGRKIVRQQAPSTATTHEVEDGIEDLAEGVHPGAPGHFEGREMGLYVRPLGIGEVGLVCSSHARYPTELPPPDTFSDSFRLEFSEVGLREGASGSSVSRCNIQVTKQSEIRFHAALGDGGREV